MIELSRLGRELRPINILQMAYCLTMDKMEVWPETLVNEAERLSIIRTELKKQV